ncbi:MAG: hypothetical protein QOJ92_380 [Frankiales bacterium]|nr:hypothetical protein [Frankiales bacterium]
MRAGAVVAAVCVLLALGGCSGSDAPDAAGPSASADSSSPQPTVTFPTPTPTPTRAPASAGTVRLCSEAGVAEAAVGAHRWQSAVDAMDSAWRMRRLSREPRVVGILGPPGSLGSDDTQTLGEQVDTFAQRCVEVGAAGLGSQAGCGGLYEEAAPPAAVRRALARRGFTIFAQQAVVGDLRVVTAVLTDTADGHEQVTFFFRRDRVIGDDRLPDGGMHFAVSLCSVVPGRADVAYAVGSSPTGPDPSCPKGARVVHVRWRVTEHSVRALDPVPRACG